MSENVHDLVEGLGKENIGPVERDLLILRGLSRLEPMFKDLLLDMRLLLQEARNGAPWWTPATDPRPLLESEP